MIETNTHSAAFISNDFSAFIDGIPDTCEHSWDGASYFVTASGRVIKWHTFREWASFTDMARTPLIISRMEAQNDPIVQGGCTCSKCGKAFEPPKF